MEDGLILVCGMSRSGTTLLTTILDSHSDISMAYELMATGLPSPDDTVRMVRAAVEAEGDEADAAGRRIKKDGEASLGTFVRRCGRALVAPSELVEVVEILQVDGLRSLNTLSARVRLSAAVAERKRLKEGTRYAGFKMNSPRVSLAVPILPGARCVYIVRDPRDVVASQLERQFDRGVPDIAKAWRSYLDKFQAFARKHPARTALVRYEDLVSRPREVLEDVCKRLEIDFDDAMLHFFDSKASVHQGGHANAENLRRDFFQTSVERWRTDLTPQQIDVIERVCAGGMAEHGYVPARAELTPIPRRVRLQQAARFQRKRRYFRDEYARLLEPFLDGYVNLTVGEVAAGEQARGSDVLVVRHDVDHDLYNALRMARWEHERGVRATYCMLHTTWYYGTFEHGRIRHTKDLVDVSQAIQGLGHEVILHNNMVIAGLQEGVDPGRLLRDELDFLRAHGLLVRGSSSHGDKLCKELDVRNYELFSETVDTARGGPRVVRYDGHEATLGAVSMLDFDLDYEALDIRRDLYLSDSGGALHATRKGPGRRWRAEDSGGAPYGRIVALLTHPVWWNLRADAPAGRVFRHWRWPLDADEPSELETVAAGGSFLGRMTSLAQRGLSRIGR